MSTFRWLHLSDFHVGKDDYGQRQLFSHLLENIKRRTAAQPPDAVFITGDIADQGQPDQYAKFADEFLLPLTTILPADAARRIYVVPGNHDVDRSQARALSPYDIPTRVPEFLDPTEEGAYERRIVVPRFRGFIEGDLTRSRDHWIESQAGAFSASTGTPPGQIAIVGVNTAWFSASDDDRHRLSFGKDLLEARLAAEPSADLKIVLGHHPLEWMLDTEVLPIKSILGRYGVLYLSGHLHRPYASQGDLGNGSFLTLQAGASFQAREDEQWLNRFLWCEVDLGHRELSVEPLCWSRNGQEWVLDGGALSEAHRRGDRWVFSLPRPFGPAVRSETRPTESVGHARASIRLPTGWALVDKRFLEERRTELRGADLLSYFDGRAPIWRDILGTTIPRRDIVSTLREQLESQPHEKPTLILLSGASGEGKTTALLQIAADLVLGVNSWQVLWHHDTSAPFPTDLIASLPATGQWLIVSDDAELISNRLLDASRELSGAGRSNVHFLVCSRDTDWHASGADSMPWGSYTTMVRANLRGVSESDAMAIVGAWSSMGKEGLGSLAGVPIEIAAGHFAEAARSEAEAGHEGSLFGALLQVRRGTHLRDHVETLLLRLGDYRPARFDLQEAFSLIAALHAEDLLILTKEILAKALGVSVVDLRRKVLVPLGDEAAIATTGRHVFTRHRAIAVAAVELLADRFGVDLDAVYERLQAAALEVGLSGVFVPSFDKWRFLGGHFFLKGDPILGIRLGKMALAAEPGNPFLINKLSQMYRESGDSAAATQIYRQVSPTQPTRAYFLEWGLAEAGVGNQGVAARIIGYSLSDKCTLQPPDMDQAMMSLSSLNHVFSKLHERYGSDGYATASAAASELIRRIDQVRGRGSVVGSADSDDIHRLVQQLQGGILAGTAQEEYHPSSSSLPVAPTVMLAGLVRLVS